LQSRLLPQQERRNVPRAPEPVTTATTNPMIGVINGEMIMGPITEATESPS
jgi:hypothetical protein